MLLTAKFICSQPNPGEEIEFGADTQREIEEFFESSMLSSTVISGYVHNNALVTIAEWRVDRPGFFAVPGTTGWVDRD